MVRKEGREFLKEFEAKIERELRTEVAEAPTDYSHEYKKFRRETLAPLNTYERACKNIGRIIKLKLSKKDEEKTRKAIERAHLDIEPGEAAGLAVFSLIIIIILATLISLAVFLLTDTFPFLIFLLLLFISFFLFYYLNGLPGRLEQKWCLKASSQMVPCILYIVVYMKHSSNLERAIHFASRHLQPPLSLDLKKIFWNVETGKYSTIKDALDAYFETWREHNLEFIESFHLIESSLYEPVEARRLKTLEKALEVILDGVYEKMLHYTHDVKSPLTNVYMLGIVLPTLGLALLPLASTLLQGAIQWYHVALLYNILVPFVVFYMTNSVLSKRPGGFGETELLEKNPNYHFYKSNKPYATAALIALPFLLIGLLPLLMQYGLADVLNIPADYTFDQLGMGFLGNQNIFDFKVDPETNTTVGPFGPFALLLSLFIPLAIAIFFIMAYKLKTRKLIGTRKETKKLEKEFASSVFQLGNRLADGIPAEMAFGRVASSLKGTPTAGFFSMVNMNIRQAGMSVERAVFGKGRGAINYYPSELIKTSMRILIESLKKGLGVAARALMAISEYVKNIHKVNERLKDLLADVTTGMKSNMTFLAPLLAAIVVGLAAMITMILGRLESMLQMGALSGEQTLAGFGTVGTITTMFNVVKMIPPYWLQIIVGIYIIEIIFILTGTLVTIESGEDRLGEKAEKAKMLLTGMTLYTIAAFIAIIALAALATIAVGGIMV
ncbi:MAG: hypothetical protein IB618_03485 [Candidatus Pacearchaeota archaeon]|nr:MAG: hypothetical protein IB618_03485 [Candidatus Pacearchaeota archaeon]